jgi:hypothetical protein
MLKSARLKTGLANEDVWRSQGYDIYDTHHDHYIHMGAGGKGVCLVAAMYI